jgi:hypothetical protein
VKHAWTGAQRRECPLPGMCEVLAVSISGCRASRRVGKPRSSIWTKSARDILQKVIRVDSRSSSRKNETVH